MFSKVVLLDTAVQAGDLHWAAPAFCWWVLPWERPLISSADRQDQRQTLPSAQQHLLLIHVPADGQHLPC